MGGGTETYDFTPLITSDYSPSLSFSSQMDSTSYSMNNCVINTRSFYGCFYYNDSDLWVMVAFPTAVTAKITTVNIRRYAQSYDVSFIVQASNDGFVSDINDLTSTVVITNKDTVKIIPLNNTKEYTHYRLKFLSNPSIGGNKFAGIQQWQLFS